LVEEFAEALAGSTAMDDMAIFERRRELLRVALEDRERTFAVIRRATAFHLAGLPNGPSCLEQVQKVVDLDESLAAPPGAWEARTTSFAFEARRVMELLESMQLPEDQLLAAGKDVLHLTILPWGRRRSASLQWAEGA
jgi:hypothetical protein